MAGEELLDHISLIALREVREVYLAAVDKIEFRFALSVSLRKILLLANVLRRSQSNIRLLHLVLLVTSLRGTRTALLISLHDLVFRLKLQTA